MRTEKGNYANHFTVILGIAILVNLGFYMLPDTILNIPIKKVDLLSDIRIPTEDDPSEYNLYAFSSDDEQGINSVISDSQANQTNNPTISSDSVVPSVTTGSTNLSANETASQPDISTHSETASSSESNNPTSGTAENQKNNSIDLVNTNIEDFSSGNDGLHRFFAALNNIDQLGRPVRIAFLGDSFIEGDIVVADFRAKMQAQFGGRGVGFVPITSVTAQYRPTVKQSASGWKTFSIIKDRNRKYVLSGVQFEPTSDNASLQFQTVDMYPGLEEVSSLKFIYSKNEASDLIFKDENETLTYKLPPTEGVTQFEVNGSFKKGSLQIKNSKGLKAFGIALEDNYGVVVDNFSLRGNSGIIMSDMDSESCRDLQQMRPYDLIVLQYGLNVASDSVREYSWYSNRMVVVIEHIQNCFPGADILILGVSDRSRNGRSTMPAVVSLLRAQRQLAVNTEVAFWSIFAAMGGQNSIIKYVDSNWASKDYTHLSFRGGREIANALYDAIINNKGLYDSHENGDY